MNNKNIYDNIFEKKCAVCGHKYMADIYGQGECSHCGWYNCFLNEENPNYVAMPNLISLNKAKQLYHENKPFVPDLDEFLEALHAYGEMQFKYGGIYYAIELIFDDNNKTKIQLYNSVSKQSLYYLDDEEFKNKANIDGKLLKDIWDETTERDWLQ